MRLKSDDTMLGIITIAPLDPEARQDLPPEQDITLGQLLIRLAGRDIEGCPPLAADNSTVNDRCKFCLPQGERFSDARLDGCVGPAHLSADLANLLTELAHLTARVRRKIAGAAGHSTS